MRVHATPDFQPKPAVPIILGKKIKIFDFDGQKPEVPKDKADFFQKLYPRAPKTTSFLFSIGFSRRGAAVSAGLDFFMVCLILMSICLYRACIALVSRLCRTVSLSRALFWGCPDQFANKSGLLARNIEDFKIFTQDDRNWVVWLEIRGRVHAHDSTFSKWLRFGQVFDVISYAHQWFS